MSPTDAMSILDKHKTQNSVEDVTKKGNDEQEIDIERKLRRRTRSSIGKQTITETLDEIFELDNSQKTNESRKKKKNDDKQAEKLNHYWICLQMVNLKMQMLRTLVME